MKYKNQKPTLEEILGGNRAKFESSDMVEREPPKFIQHARILARKKGVSPIEILADEALDQLKTAEYPSDNCLSPIELEELTSGLELGEEQLQHLSDCVHCRAVTEAAKPPAEGLKELLHEVRRGVSATPTEHEVVEAVKNEVLTIIDGKARRERFKKALRILDRNLLERQQFGEPRRDLVAASTCLLGLHSAMPTFYAKLSKTVQMLRQCEANQQSTFESCIDAASKASELSLEERAKFQQWKKISRSAALESTGLDTLEQGLTLVKVCVKPTLTPNPEKRPLEGTD